MSTTVVHPESVSGHGPSGRTIGMAVVGLVVAAAIGFGIANQSAPETTSGGVASQVNPADTKYLEEGATRAAAQQQLMREATSGVSQSSGTIGTPGETPLPEVVFGGASVGAVESVPWPDVVGFTAPAPNPDLLITEQLIEAHAIRQAKVAEGAGIQALNETYPAPTAQQLIDLSITQALALREAQQVEGARMEALNETFPVPTWTSQELVNLSISQALAVKQAKELEGARMKAFNDSFLPTTGQMAEDKNQAQWQSKSAYLEEQYSKQGLPNLTPGESGVR